MDDLTFLLRFYRLKDVDHFKKFIHSKIADTPIEKFLMYWKSQLPQLEQRRPSDIKCKYRYDCTTAFNDYNSARFRLELGDFLNLGVCGNALFYSDPQLKNKIQTALLKYDSNATMITITERNLDNWNRWIAEGKVILPAKTIQEVKQYR